MTSLERVRATVAGMDRDRPPVQPMLMTFAGKYAGIPFGDYCRSGELMAAAQLSVCRDFGIDILLTCSDPAREVVDLCGEDSVRWYPDQPPAIDETNAALKDKARLVALTLPDVHAGRMGDRIEAIRLLRREAGAGACVVGWVEGALALAAELRGINALMTDFYDDPAFVHDLLTFCADLSVQYVKAQVEAGADSIGMSDAAASLIGPDFYRDFLLSRQLQILQAAGATGAMTRVHMCGCTDPLLDNMAQLPADIFEVDFLTDLPLARLKLGTDRTLCGNIDTISTMLEGDLEQVTQAAKDCQAIGGEHFIIAPGCEVAPYTPPANVRALVNYSRSLD
ncbi:MAG TPA: uroporphyrinogen decarboxylase family protein [Candidatus Latescibacteria bacterium]|jgi:MtaA/CmuA family methyltransferase|nr:uroporphyrinogen decarboxylase family protein [Candidatus Latescibacterota bacterium]